MLLFIRFGVDSVYRCTNSISSSSYLVPSSELAGSLSLLDTFTRIVFFGFEEVGTGSVAVTILAGW